MAKKVSLDRLAARKHLSVKELVNFVREEYGIHLSEDPSYIVPGECVREIYAKDKVYAVNLISHSDIKNLSKLPYEWGFMGHATELISILDTSSILFKSEVERFFDRFGSKRIHRLFKDRETSDLSFGLRSILAEKYHERYWIENCPYKNETEYLSYLVEHCNEDNYNLEFRLYLSRLNGNLKNYVNETRAQIPIDNSSFLKKIKEMSDVEQELCLELFILTSDRDYLKKVTEVSSVVNWLNGLSSDHLLQFLKAYLGDSKIEDEDDPYLSKIRKEALANALKNIKEDSELKNYIEEKMPSNLALDLLVNHFSESSFFNDSIAAFWERIQKKISYVSLDFQWDGNEKISCSYRDTDENKKTKSLEDKDLKSQGNRGSKLERELNGSSRSQTKGKDIVVGFQLAEKIKKVNEKYPLTMDGKFIWDVEDMGYLLDPCRYSYLHRETDKDKVEENVNVIDALFWSQLYRISQNVEIARQLQNYDFLPSQWPLLLQNLQRPYFAENFKKTAGKEKDYFPTIDVDAKFVTDLESIAKVPESEVSLIIAPKLLWRKIAQYVKVSFLHRDDDDALQLLSEQKLRECPISDKFKQLLLLRFIQTSATPILGNLSAVIKKKFFDDDLLKSYIDNGLLFNADCVDTENIGNVNLRDDYRHIFFVGCDLENRMQQFPLANNLTADEILVRQCVFPIQMGGSKYCLIPESDYKKLEISTSSDNVANVWAVRNKQKYEIFCNPDFKGMIRKLVNGCKNVDVQHFPWLRGGNSNGENIYLVKSGRSQDFDLARIRINSSSQYRGTYWLGQLMVLKPIVDIENGRPFIYVISDNDELKQVKDLATKLNYDLPVDDTIDGGLAYIEKFPKSVLIVSEDQFREIIKRQSSHAYCYVWDQMEIDKRMVMWRGQLPFDDVALDSAEDNNSASGATLKNCMLAAWPVYNYYYGLVQANCSDSHFYILEPYLDDYVDIQKDWNVRMFKSFDVEYSFEKYKKNLTVSCKLFEEDYPNKRKRVLALDKSMDVIKSLFVGPESNWKPYQQDTLKCILSKKADYLVSMPTGGGKSVLFQGPALLDSVYTNQLSIVVTPLIALMEDQVRSLREKGCGANVDFLNGKRSWSETGLIYQRVSSGEISLLYVTPERFTSAVFQKILDFRLLRDNGLAYIIFDEAHCIQLWGYEFRPSYLDAIETCKDIKAQYPKICVSFYSATVSKQVEACIAKFFPKMKRIGQPVEDYSPMGKYVNVDFRLLDESVNFRHLEESPLVNKIADYIINLNADLSKSRMLIFCREIHVCEVLATELSNLLPGDFANVGAFHAQMEEDERRDICERFRSGDISILCTTKAFGMGMDIPNIHYVIHLMPPSVLEDYLQEVGRMGRGEREYQSAGFGDENLMPAVCLYSNEVFKKYKDKIVNDSFHWTDIQSVKKEVLNYIQKFQTIEETRSNPVVVPSNQWRRSGSDTSDISFSDAFFREGLYWLQRMNRFKLGSYCPSVICLSILKAASDDIECSDNKERLVYDYVKKKGEEEKNRGDVFQLPITSICKDLSMSVNELMDALIDCSRDGFLCIDQRIRFEVSKYRYDEVQYTIHNKQNIFALHIMLECVRRIAGKIPIRLEFQLDLDSVFQILNDMINHSDIQTIHGKKEYMPWYDENKVNRGFHIAENYKKNLYKKAKYVADFLEVIPAFSMKRNADMKKLFVLCDDSWKAFLDEFESDCWKLIEYVNSMGTDSKQNWVDVDLNCGIGNCKYGYFKNMLFVLKKMGYINCESLIPMGVEVFTTEQSEDDIPEMPKVGSEEDTAKSDFDAARRMRSIRLLAMQAFADANVCKDQQKFIKNYFNCASEDDFMDFLEQYYAKDSDEMKALRDAAIKEEEQQLGEEQRAIYDRPIQENINVIAGPGSGKTHILTLRCAKLIYTYGINPSQILVLAYNRAVVEELRNRLAALFGKLGMSRSASKLHIYDFHQLSKFICGRQLDDVEIKMWEQKLLDALINDVGLVKEKLGNSIKYIMIDEFQDITQVRLNAMKAFRKIYPDVFFFTIGDKNQSIYGFDKKNAGYSMNPDYYYKQLESEIHPNTMTMNTNYRSYQKILDCAKRFLPDRVLPPVSADKVMKKEPQEDYTFDFDCEKGKHIWHEDFPKVVEFARNKKMKDVAVFFRTNAEVYNGYNKIKDLPNVRIRIQGASACELYRVREINAVVYYLQMNGHNQVCFGENGTKSELKTFIKKKHDDHPNWDPFYLDLAYTLILEFLEYAKSESKKFTFADMAEWVIDMAGSDDAPCYKIYDEHREERMLKEEEHKVNVILTTMHKVKGLEFDAVVITPSSFNLNCEKEEMEEEKRLMYVAYTRAKKYLRVYRWKRENALMNGEKWSLGQNDMDKLGCLVKMDLSKQVLSYMDADYEYVRDCVERNDSLEIIVAEDGHRYLEHKGHRVGMLSRPKD
jgi:RecQ family ATP-dependent DNA helicase